MGSVTLKTQDGETIKFEFATGLTLASIFASLFCIYLGLIISSRDRAYTKSRREIAEMTLDDASNMSIRKIKETNLIFLALFKNLLPLVIGGFVASTGIVMMHYIGMMALVFQGTIAWNYGLVATSVIIAFIGATAAFWILFRLLALYPNSELFRLLGSIVMAIAINGVHYSGAAAASYDYDPDKLALNFNPYHSVPSIVSLMCVLAAGLLYLFFVLFVMLVDLRAFILTTSNRLSKIDDLVKKNHIMATRNRSETIDIEAFVNKYDQIISGDTKASLASQSRAASTGVIVNRRYSISDSKVGTKSRIAVKLQRVSLKPTVSESFIETSEV